jgi:hypothetical protein
LDGGPSKEPSITSRTKCADDASWLPASFQAMMYRLSAAATDRNRADIDKMQYERGQSASGKFGVQTGSDVQEQGREPIDDVRSVTILAVVQLKFTSYAVVPG